MRQVTSICLFVFLSLMTSVSVANESTAFAKVLANLSVMQGHFQQTIFDGSGAVIQRSSGTMALKRPGKFRWYTLKPNKQLLVADGKNLWIYDVDLEQATVRQQDQGVGESPALLLSGTAAVLSKGFSIKALRSQDGARFKLLPKGTNGSFKMIILHFVHKKLQAMDLYDKLDQHIKLVFTDVRTTTAPLKLFRFTPPKGVDVIGKPR